MGWGWNQTLLSLINAQGGSEIRQHCSISSSKHTKKSQWTELTLQLPITTDRDKLHQGTLSWSTSPCMLPLQHSLVTPQDLPAKPIPRNTQRAACLCKDCTYNSNFLASVVCRRKQTLTCRLGAGASLTENLPKFTASALIMTMDFWTKMDYSRCHICDFYLLCLIGFKGLCSLYFLMSGFNV